ncbi:ARMC2, partial [Symbiodinium microadriaticum]
DASLDAQFGERGLVPLLVKGLQDAGGGQPSDCQVLVAGILKNVSNDERNQQLMLGSDILGVIHELLQSGDEQLLIQITALLRNLLSSPGHHEDFLATGSLSQLASAMSQHRQCRELQVNIARVLGKLSGCDDTGESMLEHVDVLLEPICRSLSDHCGVTSLVTRLAFVLGSFTAIDEDARQKFACELGGIPLLTSLLEKYWQQEQSLRPGSCEEAAAALDGTAAAECEECLVKLVRLVANLTISRDAGVTLASTGSVVDTLLGILSTKRIVNSEELVLNALAAVTNLTFHESEQNLLLSAENKRLLCQLMQPMLLESYNVEALVECARALGNVSRHEDVRQWMVELRIDEVLSILLSHHDRDLVFYSCGAFVNLAADPDVSKHLRE